MRISEDNVIEIFSEFTRYKDDVGVSVLEKHRYVISSIDTFVASSDMPKGMPYRSVSYKSLLSTLSDLYVKGVSPAGITVSLGLPSLSTFEIEDIKNGFKHLLNEYSLPYSIIKKWDTNFSKDLFISVAAYGFSNHLPPAWNAAKPGDVLYVGGLFGLECLGLKILLDKDRALNYPQELKSAALSRFLYPKPDFNLYKSVIDEGIVHASIDSSDGLVRSLYVLSHESKVRIIIDNIPIHPLLIKYQNILGKNVIEELVLYGGEEYIGIFSISPDMMENLANYKNLYYIGYIEKGSGVYLKKNDTYLKLEDRGYRHLFST